MIVETNLLNDHITISELADDGHLYSRTYIGYERDDAVRLFGEVLKFHLEKRNVKAPD